jgi:hypothetical protein
VEDRQALLDDKRTQTRMQDPANPLAKDTVPPPPAPTTTPAEVTSAAAGDDACGDEDSSDVESWKQDSSFANGDDWTETPTPDPALTPTLASAPQ